MFFIDAEALLECHLVDVLIALSLPMFLWDKAVLICLLKEDRSYHVVTTLPNWM